MVVALIILSLVVCLLLIQLVRYEKELRQMTQFLESYDLSSNASLKVDLHSKNVEGLARAINDQAQKYRADQGSNRQQQRNFQISLAHLSHDIRTPLSGAQGYMQLLQNETDQDQKDHYSQAIVRRLADLNHMLDQLFMFTQVTDPEYDIELERVDVVEVLSDTLVGLYPEFQKQDQEPQIILKEESFQVIANKEALERIIKNLIVNALHHSAGEICIQQSKNVLTFSNLVASSQELEIDRLFERFYKSDTSRSGQGSGLGLAIVEQLATMMDSKVEARLKEGRLSIILTLRPVKEQ